MVDKSSSASSGIGFFGILCIVFIVLKLMDVIDWSWWLVLLPAYGVPVFLFGFIIMLAGVWCLIVTVECCIEVYERTWRK